MSSVGAVRLATATDVKAVLALERDTSQAPRWTEAVYRELVESAAGGFQRKALFVAVEDGAVQGYAAVTVLQDEAELESIAVAQGSRRSGWGSRLLAAVEEWARDGGACHLSLEVRAGNQGARGFYVARGFRQEGLRRGYYRDPAEDAVLLCRELAGQTPAAGPAGGRET